MILYLQISITPLPIRFKIGITRRSWKKRSANLDYFFERHSPGIEYYAAPFKILAEIEAQVIFTNNPPESVLASYKPEGDCIFDFVRREHKEGKVYYFYEYSTTIS
jgi:hypothetical protein